MKTHGTCLNITALLISTAVLNIFTDIGILILPMPIVWRLQIQRSQKFAVSGVFLLGGFVCVASIVRAFYLAEVVGLDPLWTNLNGGIWSVIEAGVGIVAACLPTMGAILRKGCSMRRVRQTFKTYTASIRSSKKASKSDLEKAHSTDHSLSTHNSGLTDCSVHKPSVEGSSMYKSKESFMLGKAADVVDMIDLQHTPPLPHIAESPSMRPGPP